MIDIKRGTAIVVNELKRLNEKLSYARIASIVNVPYCTVRYAIINENPRLSGKTILRVCEAMGINVPEVEEQKRKQGRPCNFYRDTM